MLACFPCAAAAFALGVALAGGAQAGAARLQGSGSTFVAPLIEAWGAAYAAAYPGGEIAYDAVGSGAGINDFAAGRTDFGASERPMRDDEIAKVEGGVVHVPATAGMVVVAYNLPGVEGRLRLSRATLAAIFSGSIDRWNDPSIAADNPGLALPKRDIALVVRRDASGTTFAFANHLGAIDPDFAATGPGVSQLPSWPYGAMTASGNEGVSARIAIAENSIGYVEYGFANRLGVPVAAIENKAGFFVAPSAESGAAALATSVAAMPEDGRLLLADPEGETAYPIVTLAWLLMRERQTTPGVGEALRAFAGLALGQGQATAAEIGYVPLLEPALERARALADRVR